MKRVHRSGDLSAAGAAKKIVLVGMHKWWFAQD